MTRASCPVITADAHVGETDDLRRRLPARYREFLPRFGVDADGNLQIKVKDKTADRHYRRKPNEEDLLREFRTDPSQGTDLDRRRDDMSLEGVDAQVIFPNIGLGCSMGLESSGFYHAWASAYNDYVWDVFSPQPERFKPAAMLAVDRIEETLAEAQRCIERGFCTLFLPVVVPWQPYRSKVYEPLWSLAEEAGVPLNFHIFSGNMAIGGDFANLGDLSTKRFEKAKKNARTEKGPDREERLETVVGMAAGMSPICELTGSGVLDRHPGLRFVVTESECGWLAWVLQAMDQMQERRHLGMRRLPERASDYFRRQGAITISDDAVALNNVELTGTDCLIWGNDYPHDEGTFPHSRLAIDRIGQKLSPQATHDVLCGNAARRYGFDLEYLRAHRNDQKERH